MSTVVWVVGTARSGTSWAFYLVASHPDMSMGYESKLPIEGIAVYNRWRDRLTDPDAMAAFLDDLRSTIPDPTNKGNNDVVYAQFDIATRLFGAHEASPSWATICEHFFRSIEGTSHWGNKILRIELSPTVEENWPDSRFLVLTRDPRGVVASQGKLFGHSLEYSALYWLTHANWVLERLGADPRYRVVDVAEMAADPAPHLTWVFEAAGLSTEPVEELIRQYPGDPERLDLWRNDLDPKRQRRMEEYCYHQMVALGYEPELATSARSIGFSKSLWAQVSTHGRTLLDDPRALVRKQVLRRMATSMRSSR
jgi:hypothetical protein